ncbi:MAG: integron integrase, partial [Hyphomicrobium sp.]
IVFHGKRHPRELGEREVTAYVSSLAGRGVSASTQNQALSAVLFLYERVLGQRLPWMKEIVRAQRPARLPVVLSRDEVFALLSRLRAPVWLMASLMYGAGLRLLECVELRVKDIHFDRAELTIRDGKGGKDRVTMLPASVKGPLIDHLKRVHALHEADLAGRGCVALPGVLRAKYPNAPRECAWQWVFPATRFYVDRATGEKRRHHLHESVLQRAVKEAARGRHRAAGHAARAAPFLCHTPAGSWLHHHEPIFMPRLQVMITFGNSARHWSGPFRAETPWSRPRPRQTETRPGGAEIPVG